MSEGHERFFAAVEIAHFYRALGHLILTQQDGGTGTQLVRPPHPLAAVAAEGEIHCVAVMAQRLRQLQRRLLIGRIERHHRDRPGRRRLQVGQHHEALDAGGPTDGGGRRPTHGLDEAVVAATAKHRTLSTEVPRRELERGVAIVVQSADQLGN